LPNSVLYFLAFFTIGLPHYGRYVSPISRSPVSHFWGPLQKLGGTLGQIERLLLHKRHSFSPREVSLLVSVTVFLGRPPFSGVKRRLLDGSLSSLAYRAVAPHRRPILS
jgi:hypothetical protein